MRLLGLVLSTLAALWALAVGVAGQSKQAGPRLDSELLNALAGLNPKKG